MKGMGEEQFVGFNATKGASRWNNNQGWRKETRETRKTLLVTEGYLVQEARLLWVAIMKQFVH